MTAILPRIIIPMSLAGSLLFGAYLLLKPLARKLKPSFRRIALLVVCALFLLPLSLLVQPEQAPTPAQNSQTLHTALRTATPTAPAYQIGRVLATTLEPAPPTVSPAAPLPKKGLPEAPPPKPSNLGFSLALAVFVVYWGGVLLFGCVACVRYLSLLSRLRKNCTPLQDTSLLSLYQTLCCTLHVSSPPRLYSSVQVSTPVLAGVLRPRIILPANALHLSTAEYALRHELTHHRHKDLLCKLLLVAVRVLHWFNPLVTLLLREFEEACEESCDAAVASTLHASQRKAYAAALLRYAGAKAPYAVSCFALPINQMKKRLAALLRPSHPAKMARCAGVCALCLLASIGLLIGCSMSAGVTEHISAPVAASLQPTAGAPSTTPDVSVPPAASSSALAASKTPTNAAPLSNTLALESYVCPLPDASYSSRGMAASHRGRDYNAPTGTPIYAVAAGTVLVAEKGYSLGNYLRIQHAEGIQTLYAHCNSLHVEQGDTVNAGDLIARVGSTGNSSGPHLHIEMLINNGLVEPADYLPSPNADSFNTYKTEGFSWPVPGFTAYESTFITAYPDYTLYAPQGSRILAAQNGTALSIENDPALGTIITVEHADGFTSIYTHCGSIDVAVGDTVTKGQPIALIINDEAGIPHCHFSLLLNGTATNLAEYLFPADKFPSDILITE